MTSYWVIKDGDRYMSAHVWPSARKQAVRFWSKNAAKTHLALAGACIRRPGARVVKVNCKPKTPAIPPPPPPVVDGLSCKRCKAEQARPGKTTCQGCFECDRIKRQPEVDKRLARIAAGLCSYCGGKKSADKYRLCSSCRTSMSAEFRAKRANARQGLCVRCNRPSVGKNRCAECLKRFEDTRKRDADKKRAMRTARAAACVCVRCGGPRDRCGLMCKSCLATNRARERSTARQYGPKQDKRYNTTKVVKVEQNNDEFIMQRNKKVLDARRLGLSYAAVAKYNGMSKRTVARIVKGQIQ